MDISAWILLGLTLIVTGVLLPQVAKSRRLMGQARNDDRFSEGVRLLELEEQVQQPHSVEVSLHKNHGKMGPSSTRPIKMAQELRAYTEIKATRAAAAANRGVSARRRAGLAVAMVFAALVVAAFAATGFLAWWVLAAPAAGIAVTFAWGTVAAKRGRAQDLEFQKKLRSLEKRLSQSPAGRAALQSAGMRSQKHWAKVAADSIASGRAVPGTLAEAVHRAEQVAPTAGRDTLAASEPTKEERSVQNEATHQTIEAEGEIAVKTQREATVESGIVGTRKWNPADLPTPSYTLKTGAMRQVVAPVDFTADWQSTPVPMRPKFAQVLPADEGMSSAEVNTAVSLDLESILERRRASGD